MKTSKLILTYVISIIFALPCIALAQTSTAISPVVSITPPIFPVGQRSSLVITVTNGNPSSTSNIATGDSFSFTFGPASGTALALDSPALVNASSLNALDFALVMTAPNQLTVTYRGLPRPFRGGESFAVKLSITAPASMGSGRVVAQGPAAKVIGPSNNIYNETTPSICSISFVDFPTGPKGD